MIKYPDETVQEREEELQYLSNLAYEQEQSIVQLKKLVNGLKREVREFKSLAKQRRIHNRRNKC